jgi:hypothetical protein
MDDMMRMHDPYFDMKPKQDKSMTPEERKAMPEELRKEAPKMEDKTLEEHMKMLKKGKKAWA